MVRSLVTYWRSDGHRGLATTRPGPEALAPARESQGAPGHCGLLPPIECPSAPIPGLQQDVQDGVAPVYRSPGVPSQRGSKVGADGGLAGGRASP